MRNMILALMVLCVATPAFSQELNDTQKLNELVLIRDNIEMINKLESRGVIDSSGGKTKEQLALASKLVGKDVGYDELVTLTGSSTPPPTAWNKFTGFFSFVNVVMVIAAIMLTIAIVWLFGIYFLALILLFPPKLWELVSYLGCFFLIGLGSKADPDMQMLWVLPACFGLVGALQLNHYNWWKYKRDDYWESTRYEKYFFRFASFVLMIIWGVIAIQFESQIIGFMAAGAALSCLGFSCGAIPGVVFIGFTEDAVVLRTTFAAFCMGSIYTIAHAIGKSSAIFETFSIGLSWWGYFVFYLGMLIMSSKWYNYESGGYRTRRINMGKYALMQVLTIIAGIGALYLGNVYHIGFLMGIGGTFFGLYLIEKWYEIPWEGAGWAWSLLGLSVFLYYFVGFAKLNPEYFLFVAG